MGAIIITIITTCICTGITGITVIRHLGARRSMLRGPRRRWDTGSGQNPGRRRGGLSRCLSKRLKETTEGSEVKGHSVRVSRRYNLIPSSEKSGASEEIIQMPGIYPGIWALALA